jgi:MSHA biogenesis protein MshI
MLRYRSRRARLPRVGVLAAGGEVVVVRRDGDATTLAHRAAKPGAVRQALDSLVRELRIPAGAPAVLALAPEQYALLLAERPAVPDDEVDEALRWRLGDLLPMPPEDALVKALPCPAEAQRGRRSTFALAAERAPVAALAGALADAQLGLRGIVAAEQAARGLLPATAADPVAVLAFGAHGGMVAVYRAGVLYLSRRLDLTRGRADAAFDAVLLQVQRSLDYFESQLGQPPVRELRVQAPAAQSEPLIAHLAAMLPVPVLALATGEKAPELAWLALGAAALAADDAVDALDGNLLARDLLPRPDPLPPRRALLAGAVCMAALAAWSGVRAWQVRGLEAAAATLAAQAAQERARSAEVARKYGVPASSGTLQAEVDALAQQRDARARLLASLAELDQQPAPSAADRFEALARGRVDGVWLTRVSFTPGDDRLEIDGQATVADSVPQWIAGLGAHRALSGHAFGGLEMQAPDAASGPFVFHLRGRR